MSTYHAAALALRTAAENLGRACQLAQDLPPGAVGADEAMALYLDAPRVIQALANIAGTLDREGVTIPADDGPPDDELVGELGTAEPLLWFPRVCDPDDDERIPELPANVPGRR